ncbi:MAG: YciI family protein [Succinivibrionaceae bacterium]|jgi:hypothetical protein|nr:YciI family protein [Succinivibrionaceae bacterium]
MWYLIYCEDLPGTAELRQQARPAHLARLKELIAQDRLILAGPHPAVDSDTLDQGVTGSTVIAKFDNLVEAQNWADTDPYKLVGVYGKVTVKPFKITAKPEKAFF